MGSTCSVTRWRCCGCERGEFSACSPPPNSTPSPPSTNESCVTSPRKPSPENPLPTSPRSRTERLTGPRSTNRGGHTARTRPQHSSTLPGPARHASKRVDQAPAVLVSFRNQCRIWISPTACQRPIRASPHRHADAQNTQLRMSCIQDIAAARTVQNGGYLRLSALRLGDAR